MRLINVLLEDLAKTVLSIGFLGENMHTRVLIDCKKLYEEYPSAVPALTVKPPEGDPYPAITSVDDGIVIWDIRDTDLAHEGNGEIQLTFTVDEVVAKSYIGKTRVSRSIMPTGDIPDPIDNWITEANTVLNAIPQTIEDGINNKMGEITAEAETLATGEDATASYDPETKVFTFGIPEGQQGESGLVARFYPSLVVFPCDSERKFLVHTTCTTKFEVLRGSERINATFLEDHTTTETTLEYYGMNWWVTEQCTPEHPGILKINVYKDVDPFTTDWKRDALIAPCTFHLENGESIQTALPLVCTREGKDGYDGANAIDDTAGAGDTDKTWSADKLVGEFAGKIDKPTTAAEKSAISQMLNAPVSVTGTTPSITALAGVRYVCGEVSTLDITLPASGCIDVTFESGATATELTITPPTGQTMKWANGFNPASLNANTIYKLTITNNLGIAYSWN